MVSDTNRVPKNTDLAYCAGIVDGEGSITISMVSSGTYELRLDISNTDYGVLDYFQTTFGVGKVHFHSRPLRRVIYKYYAYGKKACFVLSLLLPYMRIKKTQAKLAIEFQNKLIGRKVSRKNRVLYHNKMKSLNHIWRLI